MSSENNLQMLSVESQSPLVQIDLDLANIPAEVLTLGELPYLGHINLRCSTQNTELMSALAEVIGGSIELENNTFKQYGSCAVFWYGPDEWLLLTPAGEQAALLRKIRNAIGDSFASVTDVSGGNTVVEVAGSSATALLKKGLTIDLHDGVFGAGQCAQTLLAKTNVTIYKTDKPGYCLIVRRSFADYLGHWLLDSAREF